MVNNRIHCSTNCAEHCNEFAADPSSRQRVLYFSETFCSVSETFIYRLAHSFQKYEPIVFTRQRLNADTFPANGLTIFESARSAAPFPIRVARSAWNQLRYGLRTSELIRPHLIGSLHKQFRLRVIFAHFGTCGIQLLPTAKHLNLPLVVMFHGCDAFNWYNVPSYRANLVKLFVKADVVLGPSQFIINRLREIGCPPEKSAVLHYPIPSVTPVSPDSSNSTIRFLHVGRLVEKKGIQHTMRAFARARFGEGKTELVIIGDGPQRGVAEELARSLGVTDRVRFMGALAYSQCEQELRRSHVFVLHSVTAANGDQEGLPNVVGEAMSAGLPVISTRHSGIPELVRDGETGFLVDERDEPAMARAMTEMAASPGLRARMGLAGRHLVEIQFSEAWCRTTMERLFDQVLAKTTRGQNNDRH